jgi:hypothetical protein
MAQETPVVRLVLCRAKRAPPKPPYIGFAGVRLYQSLAGMENQVPQGHVIKSSYPSTFL